MDDEFTWQLAIDLLDNQMELVDVIFVDLEYFLDYVYLEVDPPSEFVDTAQMIAQFVFKHDLYPYPEDSNDLEEADDEDDELDMSEMTKALAAITPLFMEHFNSLIKSGSLDSLIDILSDKEDNRKDDANE